MERYYAATGSSGDQTTSSDSVSWLDASSLRRRRMSSPSPNAFLAPAFNACAVPGAGSPKTNSCPAAAAASILDLDPSLLRFTRNRLHLSTSSSSSSSDSSSAAARKKLHRLLQFSSLSSASPLAAIDSVHIAAKSSPQVYKTPVKVEVEEDVLVMDGVLISESGSNRSRSVSDSGSGSGNSLYKTEICRSWEESGICRYGSKCQFAHGKEELRGIRPLKQKSEMDRQNSRPIPSAGSTVQPTRFRNVPPPGLSNAPATAAPLAPTVTANQTVAASASKAATTSMVKEELPAPTPTTSQQEPSFTWPPTAEEDAYFTQVLYGPSRRKRLPVFTEICPE